MADVAEQPKVLAPEDAAFDRMAELFEELARANENALQWDQDNGLDVFTSESAAGVVEAIEYLRQAARNMHKAAADAVYSQAAVEAEEAEAIGSD